MPSASELPFQIVDLPKDADPRPRVKTVPGDYTFFPGYRRMAEKTYNMKLKPDDVILVTTAKAGSHWLLEAVWNIVNDVDTERAKKTTYWFRAPFLDLEMIDWETNLELEERKKNGEQLLPAEELFMNYCGHKVFDELPSPRVCFTHIPFSLMNPKLLDTCKVFFLTRNPADVIASYHPFLAGRCGLDVDFSTFFDLFLEGKVLYTPYWSTVREAWDRRHHPNMCIMLYEEMKQDIAGCVKKICQHLGKTLTDEQTSRLLEHISFKSMKENPSVNMTPVQGTVYMKKNAVMCRKGEVGDFKGQFTEDQRKRLKEWCKEKRGDCDIKFPGIDL